MCIRSGSAADARRIDSRQGGVVRSLIVVLSILGFFLVGACSEPAPPPIPTAPSPTPSPIATPGPAVQPTPAA